jgi:hypothetical protein
MVPAIVSFDMGGCTGPRHTDVDVRLVTRKGGICPQAVDVSAGTLHAQGLLHRAGRVWVAEDAAAGPPELARQGRHGVDARERGYRERKRKQVGCDL